MAKYLIINADDFGYAQGVNRGIIAAHEQGVVLSTSLMVDAPCAAEAAALARQYPGLGVGLHFVATNTNGPIVDLFDGAAIEKEFHRQYQRCCDLVGRPPTHLDSHHHVHLRRELKSFFIDWAAEHRLPLRGLGPIHYNGGFYGQWYDEQWHPHPAPELISADNLAQILCALREGITELACHPGYVSPDLDCLYAVERERELTTLLDPHVPRLIGELGIILTNFSALPNILGGQDAVARSLT
ncbi:MAG TPA: ChbG/HpnK family deacetylase [Candidatus Binatia bacterium]|nr:ChbG/HpnK family deacetylase [Candidatus Binatia bacterium]